MCCPPDGPLVSVIVPNYNHADYLDERISTIVNQTYQNIEVLLMDDCSPDESRSVLEKVGSKG
jgi:glycosyltransferase involved in cell wall biosynthesis